MRLYLIMTIMMLANNTCYLNLEALCADIPFLCLLLKELSKCFDGARLSGGIHTKRAVTI